MNVPYAELLSILGPEAALVLGALVVLGVDLTFARRQPSEKRLGVATGIGLVALLAAFWFSLLGGQSAATFGGVFTLDALATATRGGVLALAWLALILANGAVRQRHPAEFVAIMLFATCGFTLMAAAQQLLVAFLALEVASLSLYVLAGFDKSSPASAEAALKYFLFGGIATAFLLFGFSLLFGLTGSIQLHEIAAALAQMNLSPLLVVALVMILVAFGFKAAAAPFHLWAPDVYQGAPAPSAALIASASKLAGMTLFVRLLWQGAAPAAGDVASLPISPGWLPVLAAMAALSLLLGNIVALAQTNLRRLLAYSAIAHAGSLLLGVIVAGAAGPGPLFYYAATYGVATVGVFGVIGILERSGGCESLADLAGLRHRSPLLAACLLIFVLSLAGIPPLAGFFGKFVVFAEALKAGGLAGIPGWLAVLAILLSAVALYYYLIVLKHAFVAAPAKNAPRLTVSSEVAFALLIAAALLLILGLFPSLLLRLF